MVICMHTYLYPRVCATTLTASCDIAHCTTITSRVCDPPPLCPNLQRHGFFARIKDG